MKFNKGCLGNSKVNETKKTHQNVKLLPIFSKKAIAWSEAHLWCRTSDSILPFFNQLRPQRHDVNEENFLEIVLQFCNEKQLIHRDFFLS